MLNRIGDILAQSVWLSLWFHYPYMRAQTTRPAFLTGMILFSNPVAPVVSLKRDEVTFKESQNYVTTLRNFHTGRKSYLELWQ